MGFNLYLSEKAWEAHYQDLLREAEKRRRLERLPRPRPSRSRHAVGKLGVLLKLVPHSSLGGIKP